MVKHSSPDKDTGWGVIFRLNNLFNQVEDLAPSGDYDKWNFKLDRIWSNLVYKEDFKIDRDSNDKILNIEFDEEAFEIKEYFDSMIAKTKKEMRDAKKQTIEKDKLPSNKEYIKAKNNLYKIITMKDVWLRKYMQELKLYLTEVEYNPSGAMFGKG